MTKKVEQALKMLMYEKKTISVSDPEFYEKRFCDAMAKHIV
eukprot:CAMPEP_0168539188 /NCGR_PEP_ID=MMETSP0405-20121227/21669_1 /TAXON_ID=498012 /ORGANISM="Trichosphaerium sp, Strain Am-I-7 wt" /LENGTH=40 /DNA_ID= /DNA_START= /DNA_END= /DNA_ORIENTATION=